MRSIASIETGKYDTEVALQRAFEDRRAAGAQYMLCDATCDRDLARIARVLQASTVRALWVGSAGLAEQAAEILVAAIAPRKNNSRKRQLAQPGRPALLCVGSDHPVTSAQIKALQRERMVATFIAKSACPEALAEAVREQKQVLLFIDTKASIDTNSCDAHRLCDLFQRVALAGVAGVVMTGGDTAALVCEAANTNALLLKDEFAPGIPWGYLQGGIFDGLPVITKSGGFGREAVLAEAVDFLALRGNEKK